MEPSKKPDFGFIQRDVDTQRTIAREALEEAKKLDEQLKDPNLSERARAALLGARNKFVRIANVAATNATTTSTNATTTMSSWISRRST